MEVKDLLDICKKNNKEISILKSKKEKQEENNSKEENKLQEKYLELESNLREKKSKELQVINKKEEREYRDYNKKIESLSEPLKIKDKVISFIRINNETKNYSIKTPEVYEYDYLRSPQGFIEGDKQKIFYNPLIVLVDDDFKKVLLYSTNNRKPKNKFSLIAVGSSIFSDKKLIKIPYSYGLNANIDNSNIRTLIKDFPTEEELKEYLNKNKKRILKDFLVEHEKIEKEYKDLEPLFDSKEWKIAFLEDEKDYYENRYSHGTETEEYKKVCNKLKELQELE